MWCAAILLFMYQLGEAAEKEDSKVIVVPNTDSKRIIVMEDNTNTTIIDLTNKTIQFCTTTDGSLIICHDLNVGK